MNVLSTSFHAAAFVVGVALTAGPIAASAQDVHGAGSTFVAPVMTKWAEDYAKSTGVRIVYQPIGSGAGIKKIQAGEVDFGATDMPLTPDQLKSSGLCQFPIVIGGVVPVVNLPNVAPGEMKVTGELLARIFMGKVTSWNATEIKDLNPNLDLPSLPIAVVHRADASGTTFNWVNYLARSSSAWTSEVGTGLTVSWPIGTGSEGNAGVAASVRETAGSIGYVEYTYALQNKLAYTQVQNHQGLFVSPGDDTFQAAATTVNWSNHKDFGVSIGSASGSPTAYPIAATTFALMYKAPKDVTRSAAALAFFKWALEDADATASRLHYVALPPALVKRVEMYWASEIRAQPTASAN